MRINRSFFFIIFCYISVIFLSCSSEKHSKSWISLGTVCNVTLFQPKSEEIFEKIIQRVNQIEEKMSIHCQETSQIQQINANSGIKSTLVSNDTFYVIKTGYDYSQKTDGAFDITIGPLSVLWDVTNESPKVPSFENIKNKVSLVNWQNLKLDYKNNEVFLQRPGMQIDLGGIAKGYAADEAVAILKKNHINRGIIDFGGNIYAYGYKNNRLEPWKIGIKNPFQKESYPVLSVSVVDKTVVTSGVYERFFEQEGKKYHHIIDSKTGYPADTDVVSCTIIGDSSMIADAIATAVLVMGKDEGLNFLKKETSVEGIIITNDKKIYSTTGIKDNLKLLDSDFIIIQ